MKFLDLCAGIGGFRLGMEQAGHECVGFVEIDKFAVKSYRAMHYTEGEYYADDIFPTMEALLSEQSSALYGNVGMMQDGRCLTARTLDLHRTESVSLLSVLEDSVDEKYFLSRAMTDRLMAYKDNTQTRLQQDTPQVGVCRTLLKVNSMHKLNKSET